jgi:hypothetical protein
MDIEKLEEKIYRLLLNKDYSSFGCPWPYTMMLSNECKKTWNCHTCWVRAIMLVIKENLEENDI